MPEKYKVVGGKIYGFNETFGYVPLQPDEVIAALKLKDNYPQKIKEAVEGAVRDFAGRLYSGHVLFKHDSEFDEDILELSEYFIDTIAEDVINYKSAASQPKEFKYDTNIVKAFEKVSNIKLDKLDLEKSYVLTLTFQNFQDAENSMKYLRTILKKTEALHVKFSIIVQVESQGLKYQISEVE